MGWTALKHHTECWRISEINQEWIPFIWSKECTTMWSTSIHEAPLSLATFQEMSYNRNSEEILVLKLKNKKQQELKVSAYTVLFFFEHNVQLTYFIHLFSFEWFCASFGETRVDSIFCNQLLNTSEWYAWESQFVMALLLCKCTQGHTVHKHNLHKDKYI